jgi:hypothetical protein
LDGEKIVIWISPQKSCGISKFISLLLEDMLRQEHLLKDGKKNSLLTTNRGFIFKEKIILSWNSRDIFEAYGLYVNYTFIQKKFQKRRKQGNAHAFPSYSSWDFGFLCYWEF